MKKVERFKALSLMGAVALSASLAVSCAGNGSTDAQATKQIDSLMLDTTIEGGSDSLSVNLSLKMSLKYPTDPALQAAVMQVVGGGIEAPSPQEYVSQSVKNYTDLVTEATEDWKRAMEAESNSQERPQAYEAEEQIGFVYEDQNLLSMQKHVFTYTGGAHGLYGTQSFVIDKKSRVRITEDQLFAGGYQEELGRIIRAQLMKSHGASDESEMTKKGFFDFEEIAPNGNLFLTDKALVYIYNPYEIAPYSEGEIEVSIPLEEVKGLLSKESVLHQYLK